MSTPPLQPSAAAADPLDPAVGPMLDYFGPAGRARRLPPRGGWRVEGVEPFGLTWVLLSVLIPGGVAWAILLGLAYVLA